MTHERNDDTANMAEAITRRFSEKCEGLGLTRLSVDRRRQRPATRAAARAMQQQAITVPVIGIAKRDELVMVSKQLSNIDNGWPLTLTQGLPSGVFIEQDDQYIIMNLHAGRQNAGGHSKNLRGSDDTYEYSDVTKLFQRIRDEKPPLCHQLPPNVKTQRPNKKHTGGHSRHWPRHT